MGSNKSVYILKLIDDGDVRFVVVSDELYSFLKSTPKSLSYIEKIPKNLHAEIKRIKEMEKRHYSSMFNLKIKQVDEIEFATQSMLHQDEHILTRLFGIDFLGIPSVSAIMGEIGEGDNVVGELSLQVY